MCPLSNRSADADAAAPRHWLPLSDPRVEAADRRDLAVIGSPDVRFAQALHEARATTRPDAGALTRPGATWICWTHRDDRRAAVKTGTTGVKRGHRRRSRVLRWSSDRLIWSGDVLAVWQSSRTCGTCSRLAVAGSDESPHAAGAKPFLEGDTLCVSPQPRPRARHGAASLLE